MYQDTGLYSQTWRGWRSWLVQYVSNSANGIVCETRLALHCGHPAKDDWWVCKGNGTVFDQGKVSCNLKARVLNSGVKIQEVSCVGLDAILGREGCSRPESPLAIV